MNGSFLSKGKGFGGKTLSGKASNAKPGAGSSAKRPKKSTVSPSIEAMQLLGRWTRVAQGHIAFGSGCACAGGDICNLQAQDMEQHVLDYLDSKYRNIGAEGVCGLLTSTGYKKGESGSISEFLRVLATQSDLSIPPSQQAEVLADLGRSIDSLDQAMRGG